MVKEQVKLARLTDITPLMILMEEAMEPIIKTQNIKRGFEIAGGNLFWALKGIDLEIPVGKLTILRGRSGSGKTTLMNILGALDLATEGQLVFDGQDISRLPEVQRGKLRRKFIGFVFQSVALIPMMTAFENVELARQICKNPLDGAAVLEMVGLKDRQNNFPSQLSGGEQQRVAIARAVAKNPKLLLCDEPTGALDYVTGKQVLKVLQDMSREQDMTVVMITHNAALADMGQKIIKVRSGRIEDVIINENPKNVEDIEY